MVSLCVNKRRRRSRKRNSFEKEKERESTQVGIEKKKGTKTTNFVSIYSSASATERETFKKSKRGQFLFGKVGSTEPVNLFESPPFGFLRLVPMAVNRETS